MAEPKEHGLPSSVLDENGSQPSRPSNREADLVSCFLSLTCHIHTALLRHLDTLWGFREQNSVQPEKSNRTMTMTMNEGGKWKVQEDQIEGLINVLNDARLGQK